MHNKFIHSFSSAKKICGVTCINRVLNACIFNSFNKPIVEIIEYIWLRKDIYFANKDEGAILDFGILFK